MCVALVLSAALMFSSTPVAAQTRAPAQPSRVVRIMPMGDSITIGESPDIPAANWVGYRLPLHNLLNAAGLCFDFVGSLEVGDNRLPDRNVEARGG